MKGVLSMETRQRAEDSAISQQADLSRFSLTALILLGALIPLGTQGQALGRDIWLGMLISLFLAGASLGLWLYIGKKAPGSRLWEIHTQAFGSVMGQGMNFLYLAVFSFCTAYYMGALIDFWNFLEARSLSPYLLALLVLLLSAFGARLGTGAILRSGFLVLMGLFFIFLLDVIITWPQMSLKRFLPLAAREGPVIFSAAWHFFALEGLFLPLILILNPRAGSQTVSIKKNSALLAGFWGSAAYLLLSFLRNTAILGESIVLQQYIPLQALKMAAWSGVLIRLELLETLAALAVALCFLMLAFKGITALLGRFWPEGKQGISLGTGLLLALAYGGIRAFSGEGQGFNPAQILPWLMALVFILQILTALLLIKKSRDTNSAY